MSDNVNHPAHYKPLFEMKPLECIDITKFMSFTWGNAFKYVWRAGSKGDSEKMIEDLRKAVWYVRNNNVRDEVSHIAIARFDCLKKPDRSDSTEYRRWYILYRIVGHDPAVVSLLEDWIDELERSKNHA